MIGFAISAVTVATRHGTTLSPPPRRRDARPAGAGAAEAGVPGIPHVVVLLCLLALLPVASPHSWAQRVVSVVQRQVITGGTVRAVSPGKIILADSGGTIYTCGIQPPGQEGVAVGGGVVNLPARIRVTGTVPARSLATGVMVSVTVKLRGSRVEEVAPEVELADAPAAAVQRLGEGDAGDVRYRITAPIVRRLSRSVTLQLPENPWIRQRRIQLPLTPDTPVSITDDDLKRVRPGDQVVQAELLKLSTGDWVVQNLEVRLGERGGGSRTGESNALVTEDRYGRLSDAPRQPRQVQSAHFVLKTDLSDRQARILLDKLELLYTRLGQYFQQAPRRPIRGYVVRDLNQWPPGEIPPLGRQFIANRAGVTVSVSVGRQVDAVLYSCDDHDVVQHEAVHAFCRLAFGDVGPIWYAEGIAEVGRHWKPGVLEVDIEPVILKYLKQSPRRSLAEVVAPDQPVGSWQDYAWRWALCHLLNYNPNYSGRFKGLGIAMMRGDPGASFQSAYGNVAREISFEYDFFLEHLENGFRCDLAAWDWKTRAATLRSGGHRTLRVQAPRGWQPAGIAVEPGQVFRYRAEGQWKVDPLTATNADGGPDGRGKLEAILFANYRLSSATAWGEEGEWQADQAGWLYLRCRDDWGALHDNHGQVEVRIERVR